MATHSSILAWINPWTEEPGKLQSMGSQRVRHNLAYKQQQQVKRLRQREIHTGHKWWIKMKFDSSKSRCIKSDASYSHLSLCKPAFLLPVCLAQFSHLWAGLNLRAECFFSLLFLPCPLSQLSSLLMWPQFHSCHFHVPLSLLSSLQGPLLFSFAVAYQPATLPSLLVLCPPCPLFAEWPS